MPMGEWMLTFSLYFIVLGDMLPELFGYYNITWLADRRVAVVAFGLTCVSIIFLITTIE